MKCLGQWITKLDNQRLVCSICNRELEGITMETIEIEIPVIQQPAFKCSKCMKQTLYCFSLGYIGKFIFALAKDPQLMQYPAYWFPFDLLFVMCMFTMILIFTLALPILSSFYEYISVCLKCNTGEYEEFIDSDSDDDDSEDSPV
tara:strand:- start:1351 stop:1785 length:435 start_codon:yes stop_codon:yes gene_type:complete